MRLSRTTHFHRINNSNYRRIDRAFLASESHSGGAALHYQYHLVDSCAYGINCNKVTLFILAINTNQPRDQKLAAVKAVIFSRRYYRPNYSGKNHDLARRVCVSRRTCYALVLSNQLYFSLDS